jgi:dephospho-CoA kinase
MPPVLGLIGGIGSGKSAVAAAFARRGAVVIAGDQLGHEALKQPAIRRQVAEHFGPGVLDASGDIDRRRLAAIVFADDERRRVLERLVHPYIVGRIEEEIARARANSTVPLIVLDAAILLEAGWHRVCDRLLFVHAPDAVRQQRLAGQRGWSEQQVRDREHAQWSLEEKKCRADFVLDNSGGAEQLEQQVESLMRQCAANP